MMYRSFALPFLLLFSCCQNRQPAASDATSATVIGEQPPNDFLEFYKKFHADSLYQMEHIQWPLSGERTTQVIANERPTKTQMQWEKESWHMHRPLELQGDNFKREWQMLGNELVIERIRESTTGMFLERRFAKLGNNDWELIFYSDF